MPLPRALGQRWCASRASTGRQRSVAQAPAKPGKVAMARTRSVGHVGPASGSEACVADVLKDGKPAQDLDTYLGVAAHAFSSVPMSWTMCCARMAAQAAHVDHGDPGAVLGAVDAACQAAHAGPYALWIQFRGRQNSYRSFLVTVSRRVLKPPPASSPRVGQPSRGEQPWLRAVSTL